MSHDHRPDDAAPFTQEFWDDRYRSAGRLWSGQPVTVTGTVLRASRRP